NILARVRKRGLARRSPSMSRKSSVQGASCQAASSSLPSTVIGDAARWQTYPLGWTYFDVSLPVGGCSEFGRHTLTAKGISTVAARTTLDISFVPNRGNRSQRCYSRGHAAKDSYLAPQEQRRRCRGARQCRV